jgi:hypothetical protein
MKMQSIRTPVGTIIDATITGEGVQNKSKGNDYKATLLLDVDAAETGDFLNEIDSILDTECYFDKCNAQGVLSKNGDYYKILFTTKTILPKGIKKNIKVFFKHEDGFADIKDVPNGAVGMLSGYPMLHKNTTNDVFFIFNSIHIFDLGE